VNTGVRFNDLSAYRSEVAMTDNTRAAPPLAMPRAHLQPSAMVDSSSAPSTDAGNNSPAFSLLETKVYVPKSRSGLVSVPG
jgi:hypothetical protein